MSRLGQRSWTREQLLHVALMRGIEAIDAMVRDEEHRAAAERATH